MHNPSTTDRRTNPALADPDLLDQARPGHGIPSQDPDASAQYPIGRERAKAERKSVFMGAGVVLGAAAGAAVGTALAGPAGVVVGGTVGAVLGAVTGFGAGFLKPVQRAHHAHGSRSAVGHR